MERACDTLLMCIVTVMNHGLRNGGGVGDILRKPSKDVSVPCPGGGCERERPVLGTHRCPSTFSVDTPTCEAAFLAFPRLTARLLAPPSSSQLTRG